MSASLSHRLAWLHTWAGVVVGSVLFAIFWMGTLSVFDREIDRWMMPATRLGTPPEHVSLDRIALPLLETLPVQTQWQVLLPDRRDPTLRLLYPDAGGKRRMLHVDPATGTPLPDAGTLAGSGFIYPFHYTLHLQPLNLGSWLVGIAGMAMLALLVSGIVIHHRLVREFFVFRPGQSLQRATLDLHNLTGVLALPFHFTISLSGLVIFFAVYFPSGIDTVYPGDKATFFREAFGIYQREKSAEAGDSISLDRAVREAQRAWTRQGQPGTPASLRVMHPGNANAYVEIYRSGDDRVAALGHAVYVDAASGAILHEARAEPVFATQRFISGLHLLHFDRWTVRWLYFLAGLSGCVMIGTGFVFWLEARRKRHAKQGRPGVRIVAGLTVGSVTGIVVATLAFFVANRLLPPSPGFAGYERAELEVWVFYVTWIATFAHAWLRPAKAWSEQLLMIAVLAFCAVMLNWLTTGHHLLRALELRLWSVASMDQMLLLGAGMAAGCFAKIRRGRIEQATPASDIAHTSATARNGVERA